jgi:hypothetical protein
MTEEQRQRIALLRDVHGLSFAKIAEATGISRQWVQIVYSQCGAGASARSPHTKHRRCLGCGRSFLSWGAGNRQCGYCRSRGDL